MSVSNGPAQPLSTGAVGRQPASPTTMGCRASEASDLALPTGGTSTTSLAYEVANSRTWSDETNRRRWEPGMATSPEQQQEEPRASSSGSVISWLARPGRPTRKV